MPFGFRKKWEEEEEQGQRRRAIATNVTDKEDLEEINKISNMLNANEEVFVVARQSRLEPPGFNLDCLATTNTSSFAFSMFDILLISSKSSLSVTFVAIARRRCPCSSSSSHFLRKPKGIVYFT